MLNLKKDNTNELIYKTQLHTHTWKINLWLPKGKEEEGKIGSLDLTYTCVHFKLLQSHLTLCNSMDSNPSGY